nr:MAG: putative RNA-dependent RNA polymerase [Totiviridae sp.]
MAMAWCNQFKTNNKLKKINVTEEILSDLSARCKGDLAIRRLRAKDIWRTLDDKVKEVMGYLTHLDTIMFTNIAVWGSIFGADKIMDLIKRNVFDDFDTFREAASKISTYIKRFPYCNDDTKIALGELNCLTGYLQTNPRGFDLEEEFYKLANAGNEHGLVGSDWNRIFDDKVRSLFTREELPPFMTLREYIDSGKWLTAGSSSIGKVEWSMADEKGKFKARKNMLVELFTADEIYNMANEWDGKIINKVFTKDELGKRRLAVASNIESYLVESYLSYLGGHGFKNWKYMTLDETPAAQHNRMRKAMKLLTDGSFALPWDFAAFDHQSSISEVKSIISMSGSLVMDSVPFYYQSEYRKLLNKSIASYDNNILLMKTNDRTLEARQTGGIPSGIRRTSYIGNCWNMVVTDIVRDYVKAIVGQDTIQTIRIKGDDTYIIAEDPVVLYIFRAVYAAVNAIGINSKFGIARNICEFLRVEMRPDACQGWVNRAIPSITQRKPWNSQPWSPSAEVGTVCKNIELLERRAMRLIPSLHRANKIKWSKYTSQSTHWLDLPTRLGGFGLYRFQGWVPNDTLPRISKPLVKIENPLVPAKLQWTNLTHMEAEAYTRESFNDKLASDDIPGPQKYYGKKFINDLRNRKYDWRKETFMTGRYHTVSGPVDDAIWPKFKRVATDSLSANFPRYTEFVREHQTLKRALERLDIKIRSLMDYTQQYYPGIYEQIKMYERNGWHRTDAISIAVGEIPCEPTKILHPILTPFVKKAVEMNDFKFWKGRKNIAIRLYNITMQAVEKIQLTSGKFYAW